MLRGEAIDDLVALLAARGANIFHACQLQDFQSYLALGGIPARSLLEKSGLPYTRFTSDQSDESYGVLDKVFVNLQDFGRFFAFGGAATPCIYGPILFVMNPTCLTPAEDVAICLRSASGAGFDRDHESLTTIAEIESLYVDGSSPYPYSIRNREELAKIFPKTKDIQYPEVSLSLPDELLPLKYVRYIIVDPYTLPCGERLFNQVWHMIRNAGRTPNIRVYERDRGRPERLTLYSILAERLVDSTPTLEQLRQDETAPPELRQWASAASRTGAADQYYRAYAPYLREGTLDFRFDRDDDLEELPF